MRRVWLAVVAVGVTAVLAGCITPPATSPGWAPPTIGAISVPTSPVTAGSSFQVTAEISDAKFLVERAGLGFVGPGGQRAGMYLFVPCEWPSFPPQAEVTVTWNCTMPAIAPSGSWVMTVVAYNTGVGPIGEGACGCGWKTAPLEVVGGSDDVTGPVVESVTASPEPAVTGVPMRFTALVSDEHLSDRDFLEGPTLHGWAAQAQCTSGVRTRLSPTVDQWVVDCQPLPLAGEAVFSAFVYDAIGHRSQIHLPFTVSAPG